MNFHDILHYFTLIIFSNVYHNHTYDSSIDNKFNLERTCIPANTYRKMWANMTQGNIGIHIRGTSGLTIPILDGTYKNPRHVFSLRNTLEN